VANPDILVAGVLPASTDKTLAASFTVHRVTDAAAAAALAASERDAVRGLARGMHSAVDRILMESLPRLEIVANFGVGYDGIDLAYAADHGIVVTNTPDVLTEEVADTSLGLILMTVRELSAAERYLRAGEWPRRGPYRLTATLRDRTAGIAGLGRIGIAIARRLDAMGVPVVYHGRHRQPDVPYGYYADLGEMVAAVDLLILALPGSPATANIVDAAILEALGANGILINIGRGSAVDEAALIAALKHGTILAAGLDVFAREPNVPPELIALPNAVLLPHVGSASVYTRDAMGQLVVDNLKGWFADRRPLTPVPETPWPR